MIYLHKRRSERFSLLSGEWLDVAVETISVQSYMNTTLSHFFNSLYLVLARLSNEKEDAEKIFRLGDYHQCSVKRLYRQIRLYFYDHTIL